MSVFHGIKFMQDIGIISTKFASDVNTVVLTFPVFNYFEV